MAKNERFYVNKFLADYGLTKDDVRVKKGPYETSQVYVKAGEYAVYLRSNRCPALNEIEKNKAKYNIRSCYYVGTSYSGGRVTGLGAVVIIKAGAGTEVANSAKPSDLIEALNRAHRLDEATSSVRVPAAIRDYVDAYCDAINDLSSYDEDKWDRGTGGEFYDSGKPSSAYADRVMYGVMDNYELNDEQLNAVYKYVEFQEEAAWYADPSVTNVFDASDYSDDDEDDDYDDYDDDYDDDEDDDFDESLTEDDTGKEIPFTEEQLEDPWEYEDEIKEWAEQTIFSDVARKLYAAYGITSDPSGDTDFFSQRGEWGKFEARIDMYDEYEYLFEYLADGMSYSEIVNQLTSVTADMAHDRGEFEGVDLELRVLDVAALNDALESGEVEVEEIGPYGKFNFFKTVYLEREIGYSVESDPENFVKAAVALFVKYAESHKGAILEDTYSWTNEYDFFHFDYPGAIPTTWSTLEDAKDFLAETMNESSSNKRTEKPKIERPKGYKGTAGGYLSVDRYGTFVSRKPDSGGVQISSANYNWIKDNFDLVEQPNLEYKTTWGRGVIYKIVDKKK
jgi:hypothetical protein